MQLKKAILLLSFFSGYLTVSAQEKSLDYYLTAALESSPLLKDYSNQKMANLLDSLRIHAGYLPQVNAVSINSYAPTFGGWGYDGAVTNGANFSQLLTVSKNIVRKDLLQNQLDAIQLLNESLTVAGKITEQDLSRSIITQYITAYGDWLQVGFNNELLGLFKKEEGILKRLTEKGVYRQTDYLSFLVTEKQQELQITQAGIQYQNDLLTLNYLAGIHDTTLLTLQNPAITLAVVPEAESTVFYRQYQVDSLRLRNNDAQIDFSYKPKVNAYADGGYLTSFPADFYKNFGLSFGVNIIVPIYDGRQKKMLHDKVGIAERTRQQYRDFFKKQFSQQVAQLSQQLGATQQLIDQINGQLKYTEALVEANRKLLETGDVRMADYLLAINNYLTAKNMVRQHTINKWQIINQINYWNKK